MEEAGDADDYKIADMFATRAASYIGSVDGRSSEEISQEEGEEMREIEELQARIDYLKECMKLEIPCYWCAKPLDWRWHSRADMVFHDYQPAVPIGAWKDWKKDVRIW
jgi:hypothetical protein